MRITFVNQYSGESPKRKRLAQACQICRQRKKRCNHFSGKITADDAEDEVPAASRGEPASMSPVAELSDKSRPSRTSSHLGRAITLDSAARHDADDCPTLPPHTVPDTERAHFVSDLIPESTLLNRPATSRGNTEKRPNEDIGIWVDRGEWDALLAKRHDASETSDKAEQNQKPHPGVIDPLIDIYFDRIHPILPLLNEASVRNCRANAGPSESLVQAICLAAAKDASAEPLLRLCGSSDTVSPRNFSAVLRSSITKSLECNTRWDKITLIRTLALTSLHTPGPEGAEDASLLLSQAMHHAQTLGLHLGNKHPAAPAGREKELKRLFWCLWVLDRCNAAINGRPVIMSDIDIAIEDFNPGESGFPAFEAWLRIAQLLNKVIAFYRPTSNAAPTGWEDEYPGLEEIIDVVSGWHLSRSLLATIHLFYLSVGILSHRTRGFREIPRGLNSSVRQRLCAIEVVRLLTAPTSPVLHPMPIIPYAVSLALSVSYQHLRQSQLEHQQADAREDFRTCCELLQKLRRTWCSADVMATLAKTVLEQLDRAPSLSAYRIPRRHGRGPGEVAAVGDAIPPPTACNHDLRLTRAGGGGLNRDGEEQAVAAVATGEGPAAMDRMDLFDGMDELFGTFMDPNYPLTLDDMACFNGYAPVDWDAEMVAQS